jgi:hypothetical protein
MGPKIEKGGHVTLEKSSQNERRGEFTFDELFKQKLLPCRLLDSSKESNQPFPEKCFILSSFRKQLNVP